MNVNQIDKINIENMDKLTIIRQTDWLPTRNLLSLFQHDTTTHLISCNIIIFFICFALKLSNKVTEAVQYQSKERKTIKCTE